MKNSFFLIKEQQSSSSTNLKLILERLFPCWLFSLPSIFNELWGYGNYYVVKILQKDEDYGSNETTELLCIGFIYLVTTRNRKQLECSTLVAILPKIQSIYYLIFHTQHFSYWIYYFFLYFLHIYIMKTHK